MDALPFELISTIFERAVSEPSTRHQTVQDVSQISRRLRDVALSSPRLWSSVEVSKDHPFLLARRYMERSKACTLDVSVLPAHIDPTRAADALEAIGREVSRWSVFKLDLSGTSEDMIQDSLRGLSDALRRDAATNLEQLEVLASRLVAGLTARPIIAHLVAPQLRSLCLKNAGLDLPATRLPSLQDLVLTGLPPSAIISHDALASFLQAAPNLTRIELAQITTSAVELNNDILPSFTTIFLPHLISLIAENIAFNVLHRLLSSIDSPNLRHLRLGAHLAPVSLDWSSIMESSFENVEDFEWTCSEEPPSDTDAIRVGSLYDAVLHSLPNATVVKISSVVALGRLVSAAHPNAVALPRLKDLECHGMKGCGLSTLVSLIQGRSEKLDRLSISARDFSTTASIGQRSLRAADEAMETLQRLVEKLELRERQDHCAFRYTFLGWKDYEAHQNGRRIEYEQEYEE